MSSEPGYHSPFDHLTPQAMLVVRWLLAGHSDEDIAEHHGVTRAAVRQWVSAAYQVLPPSRRDRGSLMVLAVLYGIEPLSLRAISSQL